MNYSSMLLYKQKFIGDLNDYFILLSLLSSFERYGSWRASTTQT